jgi:hypothetical protein
VVQHTYLGNLPDERQDDWTGECQGVTHDRNHWFITQKGAGIKGQLHAILLDNDSNGDDVYFKHYRVRGL